MKKIFLTVATLFLVAWMQTLMAVPARSGWQTKTQPDGTTIEVQLVGDENHHYWITEQGEVVRQNTEGQWVAVDAEAIRREGERREVKQITRPMKKLGELNLAPRGLVILVNFKDQSFQQENTLAELKEMMNGENYNYKGAPGSVCKYFSDQSNGLYTPEFDVYGPVTLANNMAKYGGNDSQGSDKDPGSMIAEACSIANALYEVDFTRYDNDGDGNVDFVYVLYAGYGEADGGAENTIWPHAWDLYSAGIAANKRTFDGKKVLNYACSNELSYLYQGNSIVGDMRTGIGTIVHEFSHVIGLPDLYDTTSEEANYATPRSWHVMDYGSYNNYGITPPNYTIYDKYFLGWVDITNPGNEAQVLTMNEGEGYQIASSDSKLSATSTNTVYYIENRQQNGWDAYLPGHGMLLWKVTYNQSAWNQNTPNTTSTLRYMLVTAGGDKNKIGYAADAFPGTKNKTSWSELSGKPLKDIAEKNGVITLNYIDEPGTGGDEGGEEPEEPSEPEVNTTIAGLQYADAYYYEQDGVGYWEIDMYKDYDYDTYEYTYPELYIAIQANSKTALNGTYELLYVGYWTSVEDSVEMDYDLPATITIQKTDNEGNYSVKGTFVGTDGLTYTFDDVVNVWAFDYDNWEEITLDESGDEGNEGEGGGNAGGEVITCAEAVAICEETGTIATTEEYTIRGYVTEIKEAYNEQHNNSTFWMADTKDGGQVLQAYRLKPINQTDINYTVGTMVEVVGTLINYKGNTPEVNAGGTYTIVVEEDTPIDPEEPSDPETPEVNTNITGLQYADAIYVTDAEYGDYWVFDLYNDYDYEAYNYVYPELYVMVNEAYSKTAINGTYNVLYTEYMPTAADVITTDEYADGFVGTLTIKNVDNAGNYSFNGSFIATDGKTYTFDQTVEVFAYSYAEEDGVPVYEELTLNEEGDNGDDEGEDDPVTPPVTGDAVTFDADVDKGNASEDSANQTPYSVSKSGVTMDVTKGIIGTYNNENHYRVYKNETLTITSTVGNIVKVEFTCTANNDEKYGPGCFTWSTGDYTYSGAVGTWTGNASEVAFTASSNQVRATQIVVTIAELVTEVENIESATPTAKKILRNGQLLIIYNGKTYGVDGKEIGK